MNKNKGNGRYPLLWLYNVSLLRHVHSVQELTDVLPLDGGALLDACG